MKILFLDWDCYGKKDIVEGFKELGHSVFIMPLDLKTHMGYDYDFIDKLKKQIELNNYSVVFTLNYYPSVSEGCKTTNANYVSWIYDSPFIKLYSANIINSCNYIFIFDSFTYQDLIAKGISTVYSMPLAVNASRIKRMNITQEDKKNYSCDISFVGSLYNEMHTLYDRLTEKLLAKNDEFTVGFLDGLIQAQMKIYGYNFLESCIRDDIFNNMMDAMRYENEPDCFGTTRYIYANYFLCRKITSLERVEALTLLSNHFNTTLFTFDSKIKIGNTTNKGPVDYYIDMPKVFQLSKINLNISLKSIQTGIPLRAMDIMGAGGFLFSNYQADFFEYFEPDKDFVYYSSMEELVDKADYYLRHEEERKAIALNGHQKVITEHNYKKKLEEILHFVFH